MPGPSMLTSSRVCPGSISIQGRSFSQSLPFVPPFLVPVGFSAETLSWRLTLQSPFGMLFWLAVCWHKRCFTAKAVWKQALLYGFVVALGHAVFYIGTDAADKLKQPAIIYPITLGTCITFFSLYCFFIRKEKFSKMSWAAMAATVCGIALMAIR